MSIQSCTFNSSSPSIAVASYNAYPAPVPTHFFKDERNPFYSPEFCFNLKCHAFFCEQYGYGGFGFSPNEICENLYLGPVRYALELKELALNQGTTEWAIVSCLDEKERSYSLPLTRLDECALTVYDNGTNAASFRQDFQKAFDFIDKNLKEGKKVLVHCRAGQSRSAALLAAYLMKKNKWTRQMALYYLFEKRQIIYPTPPFLFLLSEYERSLTEKKD